MGIQHKEELLSLVKMTKEALLQSNVRMVFDEQSSPLPSCSVALPPIPFTQAIKKTPPLPLVPEEPIVQETPKGNTSRLLPRSFGPPVADTSLVRGEMSKVDGMPHLSAAPMYNWAAHKKLSQWAICSHLCASEGSERGAFVETVLKAAREKLPVSLTSLACNDPLFAQLFPMVVDDADVVLFFVDAHLEKSLWDLLQTIPSFDPMPRQVAAPFISMGSLHKKTLRAVLMGPKTHEDQTVKQQLWVQMKALSCMQK
jgi:hypothetical protein